MQLPDENGNLLMFRSQLLNVFVHIDGDISSEESHISHRIEDAAGQDITHLTRLNSVNRGIGGENWIDIKCPTLNVYGPFSAYPRLGIIRP
jgi:hypothetical protein